MNSFSSEISQRYALALYDLSKENNQTEEFVTNIKEFIKVFNSNENLRFFIKNPTYSVEDQISVFDKILAHMKANKIVKNFFSLLIIKKRIFFVDQVAEKFLNLISIKKGELTLNIVSAKKLEDKEIFDLEKEISSNLKNKIKLNCKTDPSLIGGLVLQIGSLMIDTSLKNKLSKYKKSMMEN
tara:strand:- start:123 stop:671 length:549 start_codon:yes stop_codon:yes gene_type:complete